MFFQTSAILAAWLGRFWIGCYALALGYLLGDYFFFPPIKHIGFSGARDWIIVLATFVPILLAIVLIELMHKARLRLRETTRNLAAENHRRAEAERALEEAKNELKNYALQLEDRVEERTKELQESVRFLEGFCYSIAHDLRAPLRAMQGFVIALHEDYGDALDETGWEYTHRVQEAARRMDKLILDLLDYGRLNHAKLSPREIAVETVIRELLVQMKKEIDESNAGIVIGQPLCRVWADQRLLTEVLKHLLANAIQFRHPKRKLLVELFSEERGDVVRLWVKDNGIGIEPRFQQRIFRVFERLSARPTAATGVGLAIVAKSMERMSGRVGVESKPEEGSAFWVELPKGPRRKPALRDIRPQTLNVTKELAPIVS